MIFVTVGTHEQQFNRLVEYMDNWAKDHDEKVVIQIGYSTYEPVYSEWKKWFPYQEMVENVKDARIVITHGGPSSFIMPLQIGKIPIVVPRRKEYNEHVNDHQVEFCSQVAQRRGNIIVVLEINELGDILEQYGDTANSVRTDIKSNNENFCENFKKIVDELQIQ